MKKPLITFLATGTYTGLIPFMPGTFGTLWGVAIAFLINGLPVYTQAGIIIAVVAASVYISGEACRQMGRHDPSSIVLDEVCGYLVSFFLIPLTAFNLILVFIIFRFFDILKPYPIGLIDRKVKGGLGVVLDDLLAGVYANICANIIIFLRG